ncbi:hypothetical protein EGH24_04405 [Halonotius terrestris]|uniref:Uncharacterized protein n=1 Tax=Halonotius terrestris TaxID=2487750 RepID=A0A8J8TD45_9EURY|nr:hypothetical protein [Halonotius terrestris]TQQ82696.1 hypothetical protein EGH24_04405 [Halonotius terrestris]
MRTKLPSDSDAVANHRAEIVRRGGSRTKCLSLPAAIGDAVSAGDRLTLVIDGSEYYTVVAGDSDGLVVHGAYDNRRLAKTTGEGTNRLGEWLAELGREADNSVVCDEIAAGERYGLRAPGDRAVYTVQQEPRDSLQSIAEDLDDA